ncbi:O-methyltransferase [Mycena filopes]|nr:O-methyltransferase [Mycena filopes]
MPLPSLDVPMNPADPAEALQQDPVVAAATLDIIAATSQLSATVCSPVVSMLNAAQAFHISSCLRAAAELNVAEVLREAGPAGIHAKDIAAASKTDPVLLACILRLLATHNIFQEVRPNVFANNRISSALDKGKPSKVLFERPKDRLTGSSGISALAEYCADDIYKSSALLAETMLESKEKRLPFSRAFDTDTGFYYWLQRPENAYKLQRFGLSMQGTTTMDPVDAIYTGFDWGALSPGSIIVDVGGGIGHSALMLAQRFPELRFVDQDLEQQIKDAKLHWQANLPSHVERRMVEFQLHDFFDPQPVKNPSIFMLRHIVHNWPDDRVVDILRHLRDAAESSTRLVIIEKILAVAAPADTCEDDIQGAARPTARSPLLPNWGVGTAGFYYFDLTMHIMVGGEDRTLDGFSNVLNRAGWKIAQVHHCVGAMSHIVGFPI